MPRDLASLADMLDSARVALHYVQDVDWDAFAADTRLQDAVIRRLELIGEAAGRVSEAGREQWPSLPWREMIGMRNVVIHRYDTVDLGIVWRTVQTDLARLTQQLEDILGGDSA